MAGVCLLVLATCLLLETYGLEAVVVDDQTGRVLLSRRAATEVLRRQRRYNSGRLEEIHKDNLERECIEEKCTFEEAREVFENSEKTMEFWASYIDGDQCKPESPCQNGGLCKDGVDAYFCFCQADFSGKNCEIEIAKQCTNNNGGCAHFCEMQGDRAVCQCARGYKLKPDRKSCGATDLFSCGHVTQPAATGRSAGRTLASDPDLDLNDTLLYEDYNPNATAPHYDYEGFVSDRSPPLTSDNATAPHYDYEGFVSDQSRPLTSHNATAPHRDYEGFVSIRSRPLTSHNATAPHYDYQGFVSNQSRPLTSDNATAPHRDYEGFVSNQSRPLTYDNATGVTAAARSRRDAAGEEEEGGLPHWAFHPTVGTITAQDNHEERIVGGDEATPGEIPWQATLMSISRTAFCGGSLLSEVWVITAAHCLTELKLDVTDYIVRLGEHDVTQDDGHERDHAVAEQILHPHYNGLHSLHNHDIALLRLLVPVELSERRRPVCLGPKDFTEALLLGAKSSRVSGWGRLGTRSQTASRLQKLEVPYVDRTACKSTSRYHITRFMFCAGYEAAPMDSCQGDSGGPHVTEHQGTWFLTGIISWGEECAKVGKYGVYTRVSRYYNWIGNVTGIR